MSTTLSAPSKQKTEKLLVPTCNCPVADTGDFDECCIVCGEPTDGGHSPDRCIENIGEGIRRELELEREQAEASNPALSEVEKAAVKAVEAYDAANSGKLRNAMIALSEALRKRGAW